MSPRNRQLWCGVWSVLALLGLCSPAAAQLVVLRIEPAADPICAEIEAQLTDLGEQEVEIGTPVEMVTRRLRTDGDERGMLVYGYKFRPRLERVN